VADLKPTVVHECDRCHATVTPAESGQGVNVSGVIQCRVRFASKWSWKIAVDSHPAKLRGDCLCGMLELRLRTKARTNSLTTLA
jgi:hypothetical protein